MTPRSEGGSNDLANLTTLCEPCHDDAHEHDIFDDGWIGDSKSHEPATGRGRAAFAIAATVGLFAATNLALFVLAVEAPLPLSALESVGAFLFTSIVATGLTFAYPWGVWKANTLVLTLYSIGIWGTDVQATSPVGITIISLAAIPWALLSVALFFKKI